MMTSYFWRLAILSLACFFLLNFVFGLLTALVMPIALRNAEKLRPRWAALLVLCLRLLPSLSAVLIVLGIGVPAYLWLEPDKGLERLSMRCLAYAVLGALLWAISITRGTLAVIGSLRYRRSCRRVAEQAILAGQSEPIWVLDCQSPSLAITGLFRSQIVISRKLSDTLSPEQLRAALRHEGAHRRSMDNLKRLMLLAAPGLLPFWNGLSPLEQKWSKFAEWAADDVAVDGNLDSSLALSSALVGAARLGLVSQPMPLMMTFASEAGDLAQRVDRLLQTPVAPGQARTWLPSAIAVLMLSIITAGIANSPRAYLSMHAFLEQLTR